jgi:hypothetical protein
MSLQLLTLDVDRNLLAENANWKQTQQMSYRLRKFPLLFLPLFSGGLSLSATTALICFAIGQRSVLSGLVQPCSSLNLS